MAEETEKKSLFDHLNQVKKHKKEGYWDSLSRTDKKSWSTFMIIRFLSMNEALLPTINELQPRLHQMPDRMACRLLTELLPKDPSFYKYVSDNTKDRSWPDVLIEVLKDKWRGCSESEILEYLDILEKTGNRDEVLRHAKSAGLQQQDLKKVRQCVKSS